MPGASAEHMAEEELRKLQVLAGSLQTANNASTEPGTYMSERELSDKMDALNEQLGDFEKRFASAGPEVKQMLAHLISNPSMAEELAIASDPPHITPQNQTPNSSDSAQTQSATDSVQQRWGAYSSPVQGGYAGLPHSSPQRAMPSPSRHRMGDPETSPMFPALTPSNSLAQQVTSREALTDCAASSFPSPSMIPAMNRKEAALANQLRHRLAGMDQPSSGGNIRDSLTQVSISETAECSLPGK